MFDTTDTVVAVQSTGNGRKRKPTRSAGQQAHTDSGRSWLRVFGKLQIDQQTKQLCQCVRQRPGVTVTDQTLD